MKEHKYLAVYINGEEYYEYWIPIDINLEPLWLFLDRHCIIIEGEDGEEIIVGRDDDDGSSEFYEDIYLDDTSYVCDTCGYKVPRWMAEGRFGQFPCHCGGKFIREEQEDS